MSKICEITGKRPRIGNKVSHANNKTKRRFDINLRTKKFWLEEQKRYIRLRVTSKGMRIIDKIGLENILANLGKHRNDVVV